MSVHAFGIRSSVDLLAKAERELDRYRLAVSSNPKDFRSHSDHAFNFVITAWHVADWVWKETKGSAEKWHECDSFKSLVSKVRSECEALKICHELATGSKHFEIRKSQAQTVKSTDTKSKQGGGVFRPALQPAFRPALRSAFGGYVVHGLAITLKDGKIVEPEIVFQQALDYWRGALLEKET